MPLIISGASPGTALGYEDNLWMYWVITMSNDGQRDKKITLQVTTLPKCMSSSLLTFGKSRRAELHNCFTVFPSKLG